MDENIGKRFGRYVIVELDTKRNESLEKHKYRKYYICKCDCGNIRSVEYRELAKGNSKSCGCIRKEQAKERRNYRIGKRYGKLKILSVNDVFTEKYRKKQHTVYYNCICDCGNFCVKNFGVMSSPKRNENYNCGCDTSRLGKRTPIPIGEKFGRLTILGRDDERSTHCRTYIKCQCECGKIVSTERYGVIHGTTKSCGCLMRELNSQTMVDNIRKAKKYGASSKWEMDIGKAIEEKLSSTAKITYHGNENKQLFLKTKNGRHCYYDILIEPFNSNRKIIIECNGCRWHPKERISDWKHPKKPINSRQQYDIDLEKKNLAESLGYEVYYIWDDVSDSKNIDYILGVC